MTDKFDNMAEGWLGDNLIIDDESDIPTYLAKNWAHSLASRFRKVAQEQREADASAIDRAVEMNVEIDGDADKRNQLRYELARAIRNQQEQI